MSWPHVHLRRRFDPSAGETSDCAFFFCCCCCFSSRLTCLVTGPDHTVTRANGQRGDALRFSLFVINHASLQMQMICSCACVCLWWRLLTLNVYKVSCMMIPLVLFVYFWFSATQGKSDYYTFCFFGATWTRKRTWTLLPCVLTASWFAEHPGYSLADQHCASTVYHGVVFVGEGGGRLKTGVFLFIYLL